MGLLRERVQQGTLAFTDRCKIKEAEVPWRPALYDARRSFQCLPGSVPPDHAHGVADPESLAMPISFCVSCCPKVELLHSIRQKTLILLAFLVIATGVLGGGTGSYAADSTFAGSTSCAQCHRSEHEAWQRSHHGWALREARKESVLGDFNNTSFTNKDVTTRFTMKDGQYFVETGGPDGKPTNYQVRYTVGIYPLQQYLVETGNGRLQALDIAWDVDRKAWYHLYPEEEVGAGTGLHWTGPYKNWQARCAECHQTGFKKNYDAGTQSYASQWAELTVSCESCHGPASAHVTWARNPNRASKPRWGEGLISLGPGRQANEVSVCGPCHSRRGPFSGDNPPVGSILGDHYALVLLSEGLYFADGQQLDEVYVLGSFLQSKMKAKGVTCSDCHEPHSARLIAEGNAICTQCHSEAGRGEFPTLTKSDYETPTHHHHKPGTEAAQCVSCHMPERTYMMIDKRRDHFFRRPDPLQAKAAGASDACTACHKDKSAEWAAVQIGEWSPNADRAWQDRAPFIALHSGDDSARTISALLDYALGLDHPDIVRATALDNLRGYADQKLLAGLRPLFADKSDLVRAAAAHLARNIDPDSRAAILGPLLSDPVRAVRQSAANELIVNDPQTLSPEERSAFEKALAEYRDAHTAMADTPESHLALAGLALSRHEWQQAETSFNEALARDSQLEPAWTTLARLRSALGDEQGAMAYLDKGLMHLPHSAALLLARAAAETRQGNSDKAIEWYGKVLALDPLQRDALAGLAISALRAGNTPLALQSAEKLLAAAPQSANSFVVSAIVHYVSGDVARAKQEAVMARQLDPSVGLPAELGELTQER